MWPCMSADGFLYMLSPSQTPGCDIYFWATRSFPWGLRHCDQHQMWMAGAGYEGQRFPAVPGLIYTLLCAFACMCVCVSACACMCARVVWLREEETHVADFDLWGTEHDDLPSKKLTNAVRTSTHVFPFYYIIRAKTFDNCVTNTSSYGSSHSKGRKLREWACSYVSNFSCRH